jgi:hypothetical protein
MICASAGSTNSRVPERDLHDGGAVTRQLPAAYDRFLTARDKR